MSWQLFTVISVLSLSVSVLLQRVLIHTNKVDPFAYTVVFQAIVGILLTAVAVGYGLKFPNIENLILPAAIAILAFGLGHIVYAKTLQKVEASVFSVLFATQAVWIMLLGIVLFNETMTMLQIVGSVLIFGGVALLVKNPRSLKLDRGTMLGLLTGFLFGIAITAWSYVGRHTDGLSWAAISFLLTAPIALLVRPKTIRNIRPLLTGTFLPKLLLLGIFYGTGSFTMLLAYTYGTFALVSPLRQMSIIATVLLALAFLKAERHDIGRKLLAAVICFAGVVLVIL